MTYEYTDQVIVRQEEDGTFRVWSGVHDDCGVHIDFNPEHVTGPELVDAIKRKIASVPDVIRMWEAL